MQADYDQRWLVFHEAGHAVQLLTTRFEPLVMPGWGISARASNAMKRSLLYRQAYSESFADVFALSMSLRLDGRDERAKEELESAKRGRIDSLSIAHDTQAALRLAAEVLPELVAAHGPALLGLVDELASRGAVRTVGEWGAEREALCLEGLWGAQRWARDGAHEIASNPWKMAPPREARLGSEWETEIAELMSLTQGPMWGVKRRAVIKEARAGYEGRHKGRQELKPGGSREAAWGAALADYEKGGQSVPRGLLVTPLSWSARIFEEVRPEGCEVDEKAS